jgi:hypothetical protein
LNLALAEKKKQRLKGEIKIKYKKEIYEKIYFFDKIIK